MSDDESVWSDHPLYDSFRQAEREDDIYERYGNVVVIYTSKSRKKMRKKKKGHRKKNTN